MNSDRTLSELNREAAFSVVRSWTEFLVTLVLLIAAALLLYKSLKYIRAVFKRMAFAAKLKKTCRENGHRLTVTAPLYRSVFFRTTRPELLVETGTDVYSVKLFACVNRKETYVFDGLTRFTTRSNFNPIYLNTRYPTKGAHWWNEKVRKSLVPKIYRADDHFETSDVTTKPIEFPEDGGIRRILCINPISVEMLRVNKSQTELIADGDYYEGCHIYSAAGFCRLLGAEG